MKVIKQEGRVLCVGFRCLLQFVCLKIHLFWQIPLKNHLTPNGTMFLFTQASTIKKRETRSHWEIQWRNYSTRVLCCLAFRHSLCCSQATELPALHLRHTTAPQTVGSEASGYLWGCSSGMAAGLLNVSPCSPSPHCRILKFMSTLDRLSTGLTFFLLVNRSFFLQNSRYNLHFSWFLQFSRSSVIQ